MFVSYFYRRSLTPAPSGSQRTAGAPCGPPDHFCSPGRRLSAVQLSWSCLPPRNHTTARYINVTQRWKVIFTLRTCTGTYANVKVTRLTGEPHHLRRAATLLQRLNQLVALRRFPGFVYSLQHNERSSFTRHHCQLFIGAVRWLTVRQERVPNRAVGRLSFTRLLLSEASRSQWGSRVTHFLFRLLFF